MKKFDERRWRALIVYTATFFVTIVYGFYDQKSIYPDYSFRWAWNFEILILFLLLAAFGHFLSKIAISFFEATGIATNRMVVLFTWIIISASLSIFGYLRIASLAGI